MADPDTPGTPDPDPGAGAGPRADSDAEETVTRGAVEAEPAAGSSRRESEWERRRRLAAVFGDSAPDQTSDDRDPREDRTGKDDDWYRDQVPPHHG